MTCERSSGVGPASTSWPLSSWLMLGALPTAPSCARLHTCAILCEWGLKKLAETAALVASELVTNAVQASTETAVRPRLGLAVIYFRLLSDQRSVILEVWDESPQLPVAKQVEPDEEHGRGLVLVEALCERWGSEVVPGWNGKAVWAELLVSH